MDTNIIVLNSRCYNAKVVADLAGKTNQYGEQRNIEAVLKAQLAEKIVKYGYYEKHLSYTQEEIAKVTAKAITVALELGKPVYGEIGEAFLQEKDPDYRKSKLGMLLAKIMLQDIICEEKDFILQETEKVLEGESGLSEEAKAAIVATKIYDGANKLPDRDDFNALSTMALGKVLRASRESGSVAQISFLETIANCETEKKLVSRTNQNKDILETAYAYYIENYGEIPDEVVAVSEGFTPECVAAYYVASMREIDLIKIYNSKA